MIGTLDFALTVSYMVITYHIIAFKYQSSRGFPYLNRISRIFLISLHVAIVITNILLYIRLIAKDFNPVSMVFSMLGVLLFAAGISIILWGSYSLRKAVFIPGNKLIVTGPFAFVRHPMYSGGITCAFGLAMLAGSLLGIIYSLALAVVLSRIADAEERDLIARFGREYIEYRLKVPKLFPRIWRAL